MLQQRYVFVKKSNREIQTDSPDDQLSALVKKSVAVQTALHPSQTDQGVLLGKDEQIKTYLKNKKTNEVEDYELG